MKNVVVTGLGAVSPIGIGADAFWESLCAGRSGIAPITRFDASPFRNNLAGEVADFDASGLGGDLDDISRCHQYAFASLLEAISDAGLPDTGLRAAGICAGTNFGSLEWGRLHLAQPFIDEPVVPRCWEQMRLGSGIEFFAGRLGLGGPRTLVSLSCASGVAAIGHAADAIRWGRADVMLAVGYDELSLFCYSGLSALRAITPDIIRPFDINRRGTLFAEGAGAFVLESEAGARARGADIYARVTGHAMNNDAFHMTAPDKTGKGIVAVMRAALDDAQINPEQIEHVNAHGTGTQFNDKIETASIKTVFGEHAARMPVVSMKSMMGHTMGAAGTLESIGAILTMRNGTIPPTINLEEPDPECDLDYVPGQARQQQVKTVLCNSYGFGGTNAAVVFERP